MTASIPGTDRVSDTVIVGRIKPYLPDVPDELLLGLVKGTHEIVERGAVNKATAAERDRCIRIALRNAGHDA